MIIVTIQAYKCTRTHEIFCFLYRLTSILKHHLSMNKEILAHFLYQFQELSRLVSHCKMFTCVGLGCPWISSRHVEANGKKSQCSSFHRWSSVLRLCVRFYLLDILQTLLNDLTSITNYNSLIIKISFSFISENIFQMTLFQSILINPQ